MLVVRTKTGQSSIAGIGLFADEFIPIGTTVWRFDNIIDSIGDEKSLFFYAYRSLQTGRVIVPGDDARHINHSKEPNLGTRFEERVEEDINFALRDIMPGEELTLDYNGFAAEGVDFEL